MIGIFDNGALLLGKATDILKYWEQHYDEDLEQIEEIINDLKELVKIDNTTIVCINYEQPMGYSIDYWNDSDIVNKYRGE